MKPEYNLIDESWIPISDHNLVSLKDIFSNSNYHFFVGNPLQKIALFKLVMAIAQASCTPKDTLEWEKLDWKRLSELCLEYLDKWHDKFYLFGDEPFLQMPAVKTASHLNYGAILPHIATGNTTVISQIQVEKPLENYEKALLLIVQMSFALGGKKTDNSCILTKGYKNKTTERGLPSSGKTGPGIGFYGYLHNFIIGKFLLQTIWLNLFTEEDISKSNLFPKGVGIAPWEKMPEGEDCETARDLKDSYMGRLIPLSRYCLLSDNYLHITEGIFHETHKNGKHDPTIAVKNTGKSIIALWADPSKRPWRELTSLLSFFKQDSNNQMECLQLKVTLSRLREFIDSFEVWSGGLKVSSNAGEQYLSGNDDYVESTSNLQSDWLGEIWYARLNLEMNELDNLAKNLYKDVLKYCKTFKTDNKHFLSQVIQEFWEYCEVIFQELLKTCGDDGNWDIKQKELRQQFAKTAHTVYDHYCFGETARQLEAWVKYKPNTYRYVNISTE